MDSIQSSIQSFQLSATDNRRSTSPNKRRRLNSSNRDDGFSSTSSARATPNSLTLRENADYDEAKRASAGRVLAIWNTLEQRYSKAMDDDDIVDLSSGKVIQDRGVLKGMEKAWEIGDLLEKHQGGGEDDTATDGVDEEEQTTDGATSEGLGEDEEEEEATEEPQRKPQNPPIFDDDEGSEDELGLWGDEAQRGLSTPDLEPDPAHQEALSFLHTRVRPRLEQLARAKEPLPEEDVEAFLAAESVLQKVSGHDDSEEEDEDGSQTSESGKPGRASPEGGAEDFDEEDDDDSRDELDDWPSLPPSEADDSLRLQDEESEYEQEADDVIEIEDSPEPTKSMSPIDFYVPTTSGPKQKSRKISVVNHRRRVSDPHSDSDSDSDALASNPALSPTKTSHASPSKPSLATSGLTPSFKRTLSVSAKNSATPQKSAPQVLVPSLPRSMSRSSHKPNQSIQYSTPSKLAKKRKRRRSRSEDKASSDSDSRRRPRHVDDEAVIQSSDQDELDFLPDHEVESPSSSYAHSEPPSPTQSSRLGRVKRARSRSHSPVYGDEEPISLGNSSEPEVPPKPTRRKPVTKPPLTSRPTASWDEGQDHPRHPVFDLSRFPAVPRPSVRPSMPPPLIPTTSARDLGYPTPLPFTAPQPSGTETRGHHEALLAQVLYSLNYLAYQSQVTNANPVSTPGFTYPNQHPYMPPSYPSSDLPYPFTTPSLPSSSSTRTQWEQTPVNDNNSHFERQEEIRSLTTTPRRYKSILRNPGSRETAESIQGSSRSVAPSSSSTLISSSSWDQDRLHGKDKGKGKEAVRLSRDDWENPSSSSYSHEYDQRRHPSGGSTSDFAKKISSFSPHQGTEDNLPWSSHAITSPKKNKGKERELTYVNESCTPPNSRSTARSSNEYLHNSGKSSSRSFTAVSLADTPKKRPAKSRTVVDTRDDDDVFTEPSPRFRDKSSAHSTSFVKTKHSHTKEKKNSGKTTQKPTASSASFEETSDYRLRKHLVESHLYENRFRDTFSNINRVSSPPLSDRSISSQNSRDIIAKAKAAVSASIRRTASNLDTELSVSRKRTSGVSGSERKYGSGQKRR